MIPTEDAGQLVEVFVFDMMARTVATLVRDYQNAGTHVASFNGASLPAGRYILAVHTATHQQSKMIFVTR